MTAFFPAMSVNFTLRFDESLHVVSDPPIKSIDDALAAAGLNIELPSLPGMPELPSLGADSPFMTQPLITERGEKNASFIMERVPKRASIQLPGYRQAGRFSLTFDFRQLPIDPRTIRSAAVEIHIGAIKAKNFAEGVREQGSSKMRLSTRNEDGKPRAETLAIFGLVDEWEVEHAEEGSEVTITGRDLRGVLLDTPIATDAAKADYILDNLDLSQPVDAVVKELLGFNPYFEKFVVVVNPSEWPNGRVAEPGKAAAVPRVRRGAKGKKKGARATPPGSGGGARGTSFWDMVVRLSYLVGAIPFFRGPELHIRPAQSIYAQRGISENPLQPTPFAGGRPRKKDARSGDALDPALRVRRLVYGRDIMNVKFNRKLGGFQRPGTVRCTCVDPSSIRTGLDKLISARWPPENAEAARRHRISPSNKVAVEEFIEVPVSGVTDADQLRAIARSIYEELGRGEVGGTCSVKNLASFGGDNSDPDLLLLRPGDGVEFLVDTRALKPTSPLVSALTDSQRRGFDDQVSEVARALNGDENLARVVTATSRGQVAELQRFFRTAAIDFGWDYNEGLSVSFDFQNFVEVTAAVQAQKAVGGAARRSKVGG